MIVNYRTRLIACSHDKDAPGLQSPTRGAFLLGISACLTGQPKFFAGYFNNFPDLLFKNSNFGYRVKD
jgi:hypothetical protein